jgi:hypothetical protein
MPLPDSGVRSASPLQLVTGCCHPVSLNQERPNRKLSSSVRRRGLSLPDCGKSVTISRAVETFTPRHILGLTSALLEISGLLVVCGQGSLPSQQQAGGD